MAVVIKDQQTEWLEVAQLEELKSQGYKVVRGFDRPVVLFYDQGQVYALDNRCPHLGFPLHRGTLKDGILVCHWHHARFDVQSGCTFDLWADDVPSYPVKVEDHRVYIGRSAVDERERWFRRLREGMEQNISLIICKAVLALLKLKVDYRDIVRSAALFGTQNRDTWGPGLTILTAMANLVPHLPEDIAYLALSQGISRTAQDCAGMSPHRERQPLDIEGKGMPLLKHWMRQWTITRHRDAAERTFLTALEKGYSPSELADLLFGAITERPYADVGHPFDFTNKAFELLDLIGWENARQVLPSVIPGIVAARGGEETTAWRYPVDLIPLVKEAEAQLPSLLEQGQGKAWNQEPALLQVLLGDDPKAMVEALKTALAEGARPDQLSRLLAYAGAMRIARFGTANEFGDWDTALHTFTYANAVHQAVKRSPTPEVIRGIFHGAISVYLDRFLNMPPAKLPTETGDLDQEPSDLGEILQQLMEALDQQLNVRKAGRLVARYMTLGHPEEPLIATLTEAVVREDAAFHTFQMLEAGIQQYQEWGNRPEGWNILVAIARYLAAHSPTQRAFLQTAEIVRRLHRGEDLYAEEEKGEE